MKNMGKILGKVMWIAALEMGLLSVGAHATALLPTLPPFQGVPSSAPTQQAQSDDLPPWTFETGIGAYQGEFKVEVSSFYVNKSTTASVRGECAADRMLDTAWNTNGKYVNEWLTLSVMDGQKYKICGFRIANGYWKSDKVYRENPRVRTIDVYCDGMYVQTFQLADSREMQSLYFRQPVTGSSLKFVIADVYPGTKYNDCAITEIEMLGNVSGSDSKLDAWGGSVRRLQNLCTSGKSLCKGSVGMEVIGLQILMKEYFQVSDGEVDGDFGNMTARAVHSLMEMLASNPGMAPMRDGIVDQNFWNNMCSYAASQNH